MVVPIYLPHNLLRILILLSALIIWRGARNPIVAAPVNETHWVTGPGGIVSGAE